MDGINLNLIGAIPLGIALLAPGAVLLSLEAKISTCRKFSQLEKTARYLVYSLLVYAIVDTIWSSTFTVLDKLDFSDAIAIGWKIVAATALALPVPILVGILRRKDLIGILLRIIKIPAYDPAATAWEKAFDRTAGCLVSISCKDGIERFGRYSCKSLVSEDLCDGDMFFEEAYYSNSNGELVLEPGSLGIWIHRSEVNLLRFHKIQELDTDEQRKVCSQQNEQSTGQTVIKASNKKNRTEASSGATAIQASDEAFASNSKSSQRSKVNGTGH